MAEPVASAFAAKVASDVAQKAAENVAVQFIKNVSGLTIAAKDQIAASLRLGVQGYLETSYNKCRIFKTILNSNEPLEVQSHYVHVDLKCGDEPVRDESLISDLGRHKAVVVNGLAGSGKSMFMKYLTVWHFDRTREITPLFVELRHINKLSDQNLLAFIRVSCTTRLHVISEGQFNLALKAGIFLLILDGFDELNHEIRETIEKQILDIRKDFPNTTVVVSSRPDDRFASWTEFRIFKVCELSKDQTIKLISSLPYEKGVKTRFLQEVSDRLYASHQSFLSSPLLCSIMLLTFESFSEIPKKIHVFYGQAFDTLFQRHDAQKEQFSRQTHSGLQLDDFKYCFSAFCAMSYLQNRFSFDEKSLLETASSAVRYVDQTRAKAPKTRVRKVTPKQLTDDLHESVCMLQQDGLEISFVHRSFQEYFAARFVTQLTSDKIRKIIDKFCLNQSDNVIPMLHDMYKEPVELEWVLPSIKRIISEAFPDNFENNVGYTLAKFLSSVNFTRFSDDHVGSFFSIGDQEFLSILQTICRLYPNQLGVSFIIRNFRTRELLPRIRSLAENNENVGRHHFDEFKKMNENFKLKMKPHTAANLMVEQSYNIHISEQDSWWLDLFETRQNLQSLLAGLLAIQKDIESRSRRRNSILEDFI